MNRNSMDYVSNIVWNRCMASKPGEKALIVTDPDGERLEIAEALKSQCPCECRLMKMKPTGMAGREPGQEVAAAMFEADIVLAPTQHSITHTRATAAARNVGARVATMPEITKDMFLRAIPIDYEKMNKENVLLKKILQKINKLRITASAGTCIEVGLMKGREIENDNGLTTKPGELNNLPAGEVCFAPKEGCTNGVVFFDISSLGKRLKKPFKVVVKDGNAVNCENKELWKILSSVKNGTNVAEFALGTNPKAKPTGKILEDEKIRGTAHIAFGTSAALGGTVQTSIHLDNVFDKPTVEADGKAIIKEGKFLF